MATAQQILDSATALSEAMAHSEVEQVRLGEVRSEYRSQFSATLAAMSREAELEAAHEQLMVDHKPTPPPAE